MAIFHFKLEAVSRKLGDSAVASWAYASGTYQLDERTGLVHDYTCKAKEILFTGQAGPVDWQATEWAERNWNAKVARTLILALPCELNLRQQVDLVAKYARWLRQSRGVAIGWAVHEAPGDPRNRHGHLVLTTRRVDERGTHGAKTRELDVSRSSGCIVMYWRQRWALTCNAALAAAGSSARVDARSLQARGITRPPRMHLGPERAAQNRQGYRTAAAKHNAAVDEIERANAELDLVRGRIRSILAQQRRERIQRQVKQGRLRRRQSNQRVCVSNAVPTCRGQAEGCAPVQAAQPQPPTRSVQSRRRGR